MELGERKLKILQAIIKDFISTAEPVGSRSLMKKYDLGISAATIRNEMSDLEDMGYLRQPYTSAGRIPSDKGYRLYVDNIMDVVEELEQMQREEIEDEILQCVGELEHIITSTSKLLSQMTKLTSIVLSPQFTKSRLRSVQLVPIDDKSILLVVVSESGMIKNTIVRVDESYELNHLWIVSKLLDTTLKGKVIGQITKETIQSLKVKARELSGLMNVILPTLYTTLQDMVDVELYFDGVTNMFYLPEYHNIERARDFIEMLDQKEHLLDLLINREDGLNVTIGKENPHEEMQNCSLVTATYQINGITAGKIGVIGPTRMNYEHIVSAVDYVTKNLTHILKKF